MAKHVTAVKSQEEADKTIAGIKAHIGDTRTFDAGEIISILADHAYAMGQPDLCFELQSMLLGKPSPNQ